MTIDNMHMAWADLKQSELRINCVEPNTLWWWWGRCCSVGGRVLLVLVILNCFDMAVKVWNSNFYDLQNNRCGMDYKYTMITWSVKTKWFLFACGDGWTCRGPCLMSARGTWERQRVVQYINLGDGCLTWSSSSFRNCTKKLECWASGKG